MIERKEVSQIKQTDKNYQLADSLTKRGASFHNLMRVFAEGNYKTKDTSIKCTYVNNEHDDSC